MDKKTLCELVSSLKVETHNALQTVYDALNKTQKQKLLKNKIIVELFDRYEVERGE